MCYVQKKSTPQVATEDNVTVDKSTAGKEDAVDTTGSANRVVSPIQLIRHYDNGENAPQGSKRMAPAQSHAEKQHKPEIDEVSK